MFPLIYRDGFQTYRVSFPGPRRRRRQTQLAGLWFDRTPMKLHKHQPRNIGGRAPRLNFDIPHPDKPPPSIVQRYVTCAAAK